MAVYYNEFDPIAAVWLRELIKQGHIADGDVDERSIEDVRPEDLRGYTQCHFFAGIGVWSYALRQAGWTDDRPVWTGSCPCQPFSTAGKGAGFADERHLWPHFHWLIENCRPTIVLGEQVASKDGLGWWDVVQADLEGTGYTSGAVDTCAAGFGAPHIRQRLYWLAYANERGQSGSRILGRSGDTAAEEDREVYRTVDAGGGVWLADADGAGLEGRGRAERGEFGKDRPTDALRSDGGMADAEREQRQERLPRPAEGDRPQGSWEAIKPARLCSTSRPSQTNGFWRDADWLYCRDEKWRPVEPGTFPLAYGPAARVGRLRCYGNAIVAPQAQAFIEAVIESIC